MDHLYTFFVQWSPEIYKKHQKPHYHSREKQQNCQCVVEKNKAAAVNKHLTNRGSAAAKNWEVGNFAQKNCFNVRLKSADRVGS